MKERVDRVLPISSVCAAIGLPARTVRRLVRDGAFPPPVPIPRGGRGWRETAVEAWRAARREALEEEAADCAAAE